MSDEASSADLVGEMLLAYTNTQLVYVAAKLGIADLLSDGPRSSDDLAKATGVNARALRRVMRGLVNRGVLSETSSGSFALAPAGKCLKSDDPEDMRGVAINVGELLYGAWGSLLHTVQTGKPSFEHIHGMKWFEYLETHPENARIFDRGMANDTILVAGAVMQAYEFSDIQKIADIGGGQGILLSELLKANPHSKGILFDAGPVVAGAPPRLAAAEVLDWCEVVAGDFFNSVPAGCDAYVLKSIIHDWDDEQSIRILKNCRAAMAPGGRLLVIEPVMPERVEGFSFAVETDLGMMLLLNGLERTVEEYRVLFASAGFELTRIVPTSEPFSVIEGRLAG